MNLKNILFQLFISSCLNSFTFGTECLKQQPISEQPRQPELVASHKKEVANLISRFTDKMKNVYEYNKSQLSQEGDIYHWMVDKSNGLNVEKSFDAAIQIVHIVLDPYQNAIFPAYSELSAQSKNCPKEKNGWFFGRWLSHILETALMPETPYNNIFTHNTWSQDEILNFAKMAHSAATRDEIKDFDDRFSDMCIYMKAFGINEALQGILANVKALQEIHIANSTDVIIKDVAEFKVEKPAYDYLDVNIKNSDFWDKVEPFFDLFRVDTEYSPKEIKEAAALLKEGMDLFDESNISIFIDRVLRRLNTPRLHSDPYLISDPIAVCLQYKLFIPEAIEIYLNDLTDGKLQYQPDTKEQNYLLELKMQLTKELNNSSDSIFKRGILWKDDKYGLNTFSSLSWFKYYQQIEENPLNLNQMRIKSSHMASEVFVHNLLQSPDEALNIFSPSARFLVQHMMTGQDQNNPTDWERIVAHYLFMISGKISALFKYNMFFKVLHLDYKRFTKFFPLLNTKLDR